MRTLLIGLLLAVAAWGQAGTPDCQFTSTLTTATVTSAFNNKISRCTSWRFTYWTNGASGVSVTLQGGTDVAGVPGSYSTLTATQGTSNPATGTTVGTVAAAPDYYPWIRVSAGTFTGTSQTMAITVYGWKAPDTGPTSTTSGGVASNVTVTGPLGQAAMAASIPVVIASNQTAIATTPAANSSVNVNQYGGAATTLGQKAMAASVPVTISSDQTALTVTASIAANSSVNVNQYGGTSTTLGQKAMSASVPVVFSSDQSALTVSPDGGATATTTNAALGCYLQSAASTNATVCKASAGNFYGVRAVNTTATLYYLRLYNSSGTPTCSSATGFIESIPIPASVTGAGIASVTTIPIGYTTGLGFCFTGGGSSTDNTNAATGVYLTIYYK